MCVWLFMGVTALGQIKMIKTPNSVHLLPRPCLKKGSFVFLEEVTLKASSFEKLPYQMDFPHISLIAMHFFLDLFIETPHISHI